MAEVTEVKVPDIGDFDDVPVIEILVEQGQAVQEEDPLITLESDKATMDVPAPAAGVVSDLKVSVGDKVSEGTLILILTPEDGDADATPADDADAKPDDDPDDDADAKPDDDPDDDADAEPDGGEQEAQPEAGESSVGTAIEAEAEGAPEPPEGSAKGPKKPSGAEPSDSYVGEAPERAGSEEAPYASPSVRRAARERGIDLSTIEGTGRNARITLEDLDRPAREDGPPSKKRDAAPATTEDEDERVELTRIQRISGPRLQDAWQTIPHVTQFDEADITDLEAFRKTVNAEQDVKVTMVALMMKACVSSLKAHPHVNAQLDGDALILKRSYHLGFAADTPQGLVVPVIRDVGTKGLLQVAAELRELSAKARDGKLKMQEMQGATFTISSLGGIGGTAFTPIVNPPQVAILGVSKAALKPVWDGSAFVPRLMVPLSFSYDHRVIDGALAARFTAHLTTVLGDFRRVLL